MLYIAHEDSVLIPALRLTIMAYFNLKLLLLGIYICSWVFTPTMADDSTNILLENINKFRQNKTLPVLTENKNAACLAEEIANQFKGQSCNNATGEDTVPGTEPQFPNYPQLLESCHLNISNTRDGVILPDCVPDSNPSIAYQNYTVLTSQYFQYMNDTKFVSAGVALEDNWFVLVLATNTTTGSFQTYNGGTADETGNRGTIDRTNISLLVLSLLGALLLAA